MELKEIIERVKEATRPDYDLEKDIAISIGGYVFEKRGRDAKPWFYPNWAKNTVGRCDHFSLPRYTGSVDAALALLERHFPGAKWALEMVTQPKGFMMTVSHGIGPDFIQERGLGKTAPIAIILALLQALDQKEENK